MFPPPISIQLHPFALRLMSMSRFNGVTDIACGRRVRFPKCTVVDNDGNLAIGMSYCLISTKMASTSSRASSECVTGGRIKAWPLLSSEIFVLPSGSVYLTLPPLST